MRIGMFGTFDVENYGDLLFPMIAENELKQRLENTELLRYSYYEKDRSAWSYGVRSLTELLKNPAELRSLDTILIGGGHLIRFDTQVADQYKPPATSIHHPTGYWLTPALAGITAGIPVVWNAPSSSDEFPAWSHGLLTYVLEQSAYVSVRDTPSFEALRRAGFQGDCHIVPDTVFSLSRHFPKTVLHEQTKLLLSSIGIKKKYLVLQANSSLEPVAKALLARTEITRDFDILVLPIGPILGDDVSQVLQFLPQARHFQVWPSPLEIAGIVAHSSGVVALSLHLSITALNYGLPVLRPATDSLTKYALLRSSENVYFSGAENTEDIAAFSKAIQSNSKQLCSLVTESRSKLEEHWDRIAEVCKKPYLHISSPVNNFEQANLLVSKQEDLGASMAEVRERVQAWAATIAKDATSGVQNEKFDKRSDTCVILHLYYPEMWDELSSYLMNIGGMFDLYITIPFEVQLSEQDVRVKFPEAHIIRCENHGRDVAPFLVIFSAVSKMGYRYICKIHTKRSRHISVGSQWQADMLQKLLGSREIISQIKEAFDRHSEWGIIAPGGHVVPHDYFWRENAANVMKLAQAAGIPTNSIDFTYVAGSMFWFRPEALSVLTSLEISQENFEQEQGQIDGTLAHALERFFGMAAKHSGFLIAESDSQGVRQSEVGFQLKLLTQAFQQQEQTFNTQILELTRQKANRERELEEIHASKAWRLVLALRRIRLVLAPVGSTREHILKLTLQGFRLFRSANFKVLSGKLFSALKRSGLKLSPLPRLRRKASSLGRNEVYVPINPQDVDPSDISVKIIAFYLPQFHPIPENNEWWGEGFTEWTNVTRALPNFVNHYQPHRPGELGYYDLRLPEVQQRQIELARKYGIYGFCFYYYWFAGKRLLERPIDQYLANPSLDLPFCLCWANENWTRRWDGAEHEILIAQDYTDEQYLHFIRDISVNFRDPRYIKIDGKPVLLVYRVNLLPDPQKAAEIWRSECRRSGIGEIYLVAVQSFGITDPRPFGFDAAVEFPPSHLGDAEIGLNAVEITNPNFKGRIFDYNIAARLMLEKEQGNYTYFKTVMPSWDNTARKQNKGHIFINASPSSYRDWLTKAVKLTEGVLPEEKRFLFVNAWNEWAEGTHLEPDARYGYAYLQATAEAITKKSSHSSWTILFVSHDANRGGAQEVLINTITWFHQHTNIHIKILCLQGGEWLSRFKEVGDTITLDELGPFKDEKNLTDRLVQFCEGSPDLIYGNSIASGSAYHWLLKLNTPVLTHLHELESSIRKYGGNWAETVMNHSTHFIACSKAVQDNLIQNHNISPEKISLVYASIKSKEVGILDDKTKTSRRKQLGLARDRLIVFGCGIGMPFRKGADLFIQLGETLLQKGYRNFHFYWVGGFDPSYEDEHHGPWGHHLAKLKNPVLKEYITFLGPKENPRDYFRCGDVFVLPSREDPFPLVALEAADCGLPIVCFDKAGGMPDFVGDEAGFVVPFIDIEMMAQKLILLLENRELRQDLGVNAREKLLSEFTTDQTAPHIFSSARRTANKKPAVSVIVPNYNHEPFLGSRLKSIFEQTFRDFEVILLDDASTDNSLAILSEYRRYPDVQIVCNSVNSGSPFKQWIKGIDQAKSDILWIAESDDRSAPKFLETLLPAFKNPNVKLAYANSHIMDERDAVVGDYLGTEYLTSLSRTKWSTDYEITAEQEINDGLGIKNTILNISAALVRRFELEKEFRATLENMHIAGDWYFIVQAIKDGKIVYVANKLNYHRRHSNSVIAQTVSERKLKDFFQEFFVVQSHIVGTYRLHAGFLRPWEGYLRKQWSEFTGDQPFEGISEYYPFDKIYQAIKANIGDR